MLLRTTFILALALTPAPLLAQSPPLPIGVSDADALAEQVRRLGANPLDLDALLTAAELSLRLDDLSAAGSFLARAEKIAPSGGRGLAVRGAVLVRSERPGEALRLFAQAEAAGLSPERFAADRGLAYDLIGDQPRAQRDFRLALRHGGDDEVRRRLALSLGIAGREREALDELAPLVRRNDRAAWRTRAFVLAMGGEAAEASRIAATMMPPGSAQGLKTFFDELPRLPAVDRAFAVHFGEVRPSPTRLADARLAPALAPLAAEPAPAQVAMVVPQPAPPRDKGKRAKAKLGPGRVEITYAPTPAPAEPLPPPPAYQAPVYQPPSYRPPARPVVAANTADRPLTAGEQASLAAATLRPEQRRGRRTTPTVTPAPAPSPAAVDRRPVEVAVAIPMVRTARPPTSVAAAPLSVTTGAVKTPTTAMASSEASVAALPPTVVAARPTSLLPPAMNAAPSATEPQPSPAGAATTVPVYARTDALGPAVAPEASAAVTATPLAPLVKPQPAPLVAIEPAPRAVRAGRGKGDDILAKIVANLSIPASELGVAGAKSARAADKMTPAERKKALAADKAESKKASAADAAEVEAKPVDRKAEAKRALAERKAAAEKKALAAKEAAEKKAARAEPERIWVQVAGGANARDLAKAWKAAQAKAPVLAGKQGYTTPLRATNRVLAGPFKTEAEAREAVNQLAKSGVSAFSFTSEAGQRISRLAGK